MTLIAQRSDEASRELIKTAIDDTLIVEAAAGTGKTTELVNRIVTVLGSGRAEVREIVAVTFTEKAAGELKLRIRQQLEVVRGSTTDPEVMARLESAVQNLEEAHVSTIHGFCADLLRERPVEARVDPLFRVLTESQAERLFGDAFDAWFHRRLENPPEGIRRSLRRSSRGALPGEPAGDGPLDRLRRAGFDLTQWRDFRTAWAREPFDRAGAAARLVDLVHALAEISARPSYAGDNLYVDTDPVRHLSRDLRARENEVASRSDSRPDCAILSGEDLDDLEARLVDLRRNRDFKRGRKGSGPTYKKGATRAQVLQARDELTLALAEFQIRADADLAALLHGELLECVDQYEALKAREGALDFLDLLLRARDLIRDDTSVRQHFQRRFKRIFVDEFQDTDPLQAELLVLLAASEGLETRWQQVTPVPGKLFVVGDPKQSIYRFRRADVDLYRRVCEQLEAAGGTRVELRKSFRSVTNIQRVVNAAFAPIMDGDVETLQARYMPLEPARGDHAGQPSVVVLPVPRPYGPRFVAARQIEESLPDAVGAYIDWLVHHSGWTVTERRDPKRMPLDPRHICILFRRFVSFGEDITRKYVEALEARGIRHLLVGGKTFHDREEIETLRAALMAIEWPDDQLSVFATLRGALFAIGDEELLEYHHLGGRFQPFRILEALPPRLEPITKALTLLAALHRQRNRRPVADTISELLDRTRAHVGFVLRPGGEQALANVLHVAELARQYEIDGGMSFRGFVDTLQAEASSGHAAEAPILEEGSDGVRLMTVHKAKGLEFPVVVLADITARLTPYEAGRHIDSDRKLCALRIGGWSPADLNDNKDREIRRERREGERLAYVAATRARDLLVVPGIGDEPYNEGWAAPLNGAIYPPEQSRRTPSAGAGCPAFKSRDSVLNRPDGDPATSRTVCPGEHRFGSDDQAYSLVWWSPDSLVLDAQPPLGLRRDDLIVKDISPEIQSRYRREYDAWRAARASAITAASMPSLMVMTATEAAKWPGASLAERSVMNGGSREQEPPSGMVNGGSQPQDQPYGVDVTIEEVPGAGRRPGGIRFGTLVHALLADVSLSAPTDDSLARLAVAHGRVLGADSGELVAAQEVISAVLQHPLVRDAAHAFEQGRCYRETPVTWRQSDGAIIEGTVDLAFETESGFVVVDFKTDRELTGSLDEYRRQVAIYASAIAAATGRPARAVLMRV
jgi:ATP-dependent exoDNAse (exonuclease V) beta subunit